MGTSTVRAPSAGAAVLCEDVFWGSGDFPALGYDDRLVQFMIASPGAGTGQSYTHATVPVTVQADEKTELWQWPRQ